MSKRLYSVTVKGASRPGPGLTRLVEASSPAQARSHVAQLFFDVEIPTPLDAARLVAAGTPIEKAGDALHINHNHPFASANLPEPGPGVEATIQPGMPVASEAVELRQAPALGDEPPTFIPAFMSPMAPPELSPEMAERERQIREGPDVEAAMAFRAAQREMAAIRPGLAGQLADRLVQDGVIGEEAAKRLAETGELA